MNLSNNITWTDILTLVLLLVTVSIFTISVFREKRKANDLLQAKNYYFLSLMLQLQRKKLSKSLSKFATLLGEEGRESFDLKFHPIVESRSLKNIAVEDLLEYYSKPVKNQNAIDFEHIQRSWFYCFEYCQQWESCREDALKELKEIDERSKVFYDEFFKKYEKIEIDIKRYISSDYSTSFFDPFVELLDKHQNLIESNQKLPCMYSIVEDIYKPIRRIYPKDDYWVDRDILEMIQKGQKIYSLYWVFIQEKIRHFTVENEKQYNAEIEFDMSVIILIHYSYQHSSREFRDMYKTLAKQMGMDYDAARMSRSRI